MPAPGPPWVYLEAAAAILSAIAWLAMAAAWLRPLPLTRAVRITGTLLLASAALSTLLPLLGHHATPAAAINHLFGAIVFLLFIAALGRQFALAKARRHTPTETPPDRQ